MKESEDTEIRSPLRRSGTFARERLKPRNRAAL